MSAVVTVVPKGLTLHFQGSGCGKYHSKRPFPTALVPLTPKNPDDDLVAYLDGMFVQGNARVVFLMGLFYLQEDKSVDSC